MKTKNAFILINIFLLIGLGLTPSINADVSYLTEKMFIGIISSNHPPIYIDGNDNFTSENGVTGGSGTEDDPYIIENWIIVGNGSVSDGIFINNTDAYFVIQTCMVSDFDLSGNSGIKINNAKNGKIDNTTSYENHYGIFIEDSTYIEIVNCLWYNIDYKGLFCTETSNIKISSCECYDINQISAMDILDCSNILIENTFFHDCNKGIWANERYNSSNLLMNITIKDCKFHNIVWDGIRLRTREIHPIFSQISGCEFYNNGWDYVSSGIWFERGTHNTVENCTFHHNRIGIAINTNHNIVQNCTLYNNKDGFQIRGAWVPPFFIYFAKNNTVIYCDIYDGEVGLNMGTIVRTHIEKNNIYNNSWFGIMAFPYCKIDIHNNNICNNGFAENRQYASGLFCSKSIIDSRNNWWGADNGPRCRFHFGNGDKIKYMMSLVFKRPWTTEPIPDAGVN
jgi:parallel beta-helix repeat protein